MKNFFLLLLMFTYGMVFTNIATAQMIEGKVNKYYVVVGSYNSMKYANAALKRMENKTKNLLFVLSIPDKKLFRVCYGQAKTKEEIVGMKEQAGKDFANAWILYL